MSVTKLSELKEAFQNKIVPLLQEYFFGDYGKIGLVVGKGFVESAESVQEKFFAEFNEYDSSAFAERTIYQIRDISKMTEDDFKTAITELLKK
jgi:5-methylcytosine-specific restriction protein B